jgi:hypothetical protein
MIRPVEKNGKIKHPKICKNILNLYVMVYDTPKIRLCRANVLNVPTVCDDLAARIRALRNKDQDRQNVAELWRGNGQSN